MFIFALKKIRSDEHVCLFYYPSLKKLSSLFILFLLFSPSLLAQEQETTLSPFEMQAIHVKGVLRDDQGHLFSWNTAQMNGNLKTRFLYLDKPLITLHASSPIEIQSDRLKIDMVQKDLMFEGNIRVKFQNGTLKTHFLKVNALNQTLTSFDFYTFDPSTLMKDQRVKGRAFYGSSQEKRLQLLNIENASQTASFIPLIF